MNDFNTILSAVKQAVDAQLTKIFVPSANAEFIFKPLTAKQQKDLVKTAAEKNTGVVSFFECINNVIQTNTTRQHDFTVFDREYIITLLRANNLSAKYTMKSKEYNLKELDSNRVALPQDVSSTTISTAEITIVCKIPTLKTDSTYNNFMLKSAKKDTAETFGDMFIFEVAKYIDKVQSSSLGFDVSFSDLSIQQRYSLVESLPAKIYNQVIEYINNVKTAEEQMFKIADEIVDIELDQSFFTV